MSRLAALLMSLGVTVAGLVIIIGMVVIDTPFVPFMLVLTSCSIVSIPVRRKLARKTDRTTLPSNIPREDARMFWDDVVNATFLSVLQNKGIAVDIATSASLTRG